MPTKRVRGPMGNTVFIETREEPSGYDKTAAKNAVAKRTAALISVEVSLFEAIRDTHLALSEYRIALALRLTSLQERIDTLRKQLDLLETFTWQSDANIAFCMSTKRAVHPFRELLAASAPDPLAVSRASKELREVLHGLERREPHNDEEPPRTGFGVVRAFCR
jgi:hypothetical protein